MNNGGKNGDVVIYDVILGFLITFILAYWKLNILITYNFIYISVDINLTILYFIYIKFNNEHTILNRFFILFISNMIRNKK